MDKIKNKSNNYYLIESETFVEGELVKTYGIGCRNEEIKAILDISTDKSKVEKLVYAMNAYELDPIQFNEVCEDSII